MDFISEVIKRKAVNPKAGGEGELERANYIQEFLESEYGVKVRRYETKDDNGFLRPNLIVEIGKGKTVWILSHLDTVSEGDKELWKYPPFEATFEDGKVYGRGVSDNGIGIFSSVILLDRIIRTGEDLKYKLKLAFLSDEEAGSKYGLKFLLERTEEFKKGDWAIVPDIGNERGDFVEVAEKSILWMRFEVLGKQAHGSRPNEGINANLHSMRFQTELYEEIHKKFSDEDPIFSPPKSTFEPTKREKNVDAVNIIPGRDISYWDCRVLPRYKIEEVLEFVRRKAEEYEKREGVKVKVEVVMREDPSMTDKDSELVKKIEGSIRRVLGVEPKEIGVGGGTLAGVLRKVGIEAVAWSICSETAHKENEYELIDNYYKNADVFFDFLTS